MNFKRLFKKETGTWVLVLVTLFIGFFSVWTSNFLYQSRGKSISPAAPESNPEAAGNCTLTYAIPTPTTVQSSTCKVEMELEDTGVCWLDPRTVAVKYTVKSLPTTGGPFYVQTQWRQVLPVEDTNYHYAQVGPVSAGYVGTINVQWPGVKPGQTATSETHARATVYKSDGTPVQNCTDGMDYYWTPFVCAAPTPTGTSATGAAISNLTVADSANSSDWSLRTNLQVGNQMYGDRSYTFSNIPSTLLGKEWVRTANDSKSFSGSTLVSFKLNRNANVYVAHDNRLTTKPSWLTGWIDTGLTVKNTDADAVNGFKLYRKAFTSGSTVSLGSNGSTSGALYTVIVE